MYFQEISSQPKIVAKIQSLHALTSRKHRVTTKQAATKARLAASRSLFGAPLEKGLATSGQRAMMAARRIGPEWALRRDSLTEIAHPMKAIVFVMDSTHISPK